MSLTPKFPLDNVYWLGGSPCAVKSTVANAIADRLGWRVYHCDDWFADHRERSNPVQQPTFHHLSHLQGDALWLRPVAQQIASEIHFCAEEFSLVLEDIERMVVEEERPLLFEGAAALPHLLAPLLPQPHHAFWLIPAEAFQRQHYARRPWVDGILAATSNPAQAFENWMSRDAGFARWLETEAVKNGLSWLQVDGSLSIAETVSHVTRHFLQG